VKSRLDTNRPVETRSLGFFSSYPKPPGRPIPTDPGRVPYAREALHQRSVVRSRFRFSINLSPRRQGRKEKSAKKARDGVRQLAISRRVEVLCPYGGWRRAPKVREITLGVG
jgi:hypothetical protein